MYLCHLLEKYVIVLNLIIIFLTRSLAKMEFSKKDDAAFAVLPEESFLFKKGRISINAVAIAATDNTLLITGEN